MTQHLDKNLRKCSPRSRRWLNPPAVAGFPEHRVHELSMSRPVAFWLRCAHPAILFDQNAGPGVQRARKSEERIARLNDEA